MYRKYDFDIGDSVEFNDDSKRKWIGKLLAFYNDAALLKIEGYPGHLCTSEYDFKDKSGESIKLTLTPTMDHYFVQLVKLKKYLGEDLLIFNQYKIGQVVVSLDRVFNSREKGDIFKVRKESTKDRLYYKEHTNSRDFKSWRAAIPEEIEAFESGIKNINDIVSASKKEPPSEILVFDKYHIGQVVVSLKEVDGGSIRKKGEMFKVMGKSTKDVLYYKEHNSSDKSSTWREATPEETEAYNKGIRHINDISPVKQEKTKTHKHKFKIGDYIESYGFRGTIIGFDSDPESSIDILIKNVYEYQPDEDKYIKMDGHNGKLSKDRVVDDNGVDITDNLPNDAKDCWWVTSVDAEIVYKSNLERAKEEYPDGCYIRTISNPANIRGPIINKYISESAINKDGIICTLEDQSFYLFYNNKWAEIIDKPKDKQSQSSKMEAFEDDINNINDIKHPKFKVGDKVISTTEGTQHYDPKGGVGKGISSTAGYKSIIIDCIKARDTFWYKLKTICSLDHILGNWYSESALQPLVEKVKQDKVMDYPLVLSECYIPVSDHKTVSAEYYMMGIDPCEEEPKRTVTYPLLSEERIEYTRPEEPKEPIVIKPNYGIL